MNLDEFVCCYKQLSSTIIIIFLEQSGPAALLISQSMLLILDFSGTF